MPFCQECGYQFEAGAKFCPKCGARVSYPTAPGTGTAKTKTKEKNEPKAETVDLPENEREFARPKSDAYRNPDDSVSSEDYRNSTGKITTPVYKKWWFWVLVAIAVSYCAIQIGASKAANSAINAESNRSNNYSYTQIEKPTAKPTATPKPAATPTPTAKPDISSDNNTSKSETLPEKKTDGIDPDFKAMMDAYEDFFDEYAEFMDSYAKNPTDMQLLMKYVEILEKYEEAMEALDEIDTDELNEQELAYYLAVTARIEKRLLETIG